MTIPKRLVKQAPKIKAALKEVLGLKHGIYANSTKINTRTFLGTELNSGTKKEDLSFHIGKIYTGNEKPFSRVVEDFQKNISEPIHQEIQKIMKDFGIDRTNLILSTDPKAARITRTKGVNNVPGNTKIKIDSALNCYKDNGAWAMEPTRWYSPLITFCKGVMTNKQL